MDYIAPETITEKELKEANKWLETVEQFKGIDALYDITEKEYLYPGDESHIHKFNDRHQKDNKRFVLNTIPYPWLGNPLKAKVIILSQNPGWVESSGKVIALMLQQIPEVANELMEFFKNTYSLRGNSFMPEDRNAKFGITIRDAFNAMGDWYWKKRLHFLIDAGVNEETLYDNIALIQYLPYSSVSFAALPKNTILPSQKFTKTLIDYIQSNNKETVFVVLRAVGLWEGFLGDTWTSLKEDGRIITHEDRAYRSQYISPNCLANDGFKKIVDKLKSC